MDDRNIKKHNVVGRFIVQQTNSFLVVLSLHEVCCRDNACFTVFRNYFAVH